MPLIQILSYSQKKEFETPPVLNNELRQEVFSLPLSLERQMIAIDKAINKARFIAMFGYFKVTRSFYEPSMFYENDIDYIARRYDLKIDDISSAKNTIALYKKIIREHFGYMAPDENLKQKLINESQRLIVGLSTPKAVFYALVESAIAYRYEVPSYTFLSKIITEAMNTHRGNIFERLKSYSAHTALQPLELFYKPMKPCRGATLLHDLRSFLIRSNLRKLKKKSVPMRHSVIYIPH